ncbi:hypothetical protein [Leifsonia sp. NPDC077715]|uniref:SLAC1 family transporter n=1 Tax=Leifsonia sp. NPDC077715 TaxID=3155539 RepID=UPI0034238760
MTGPQTDEPGAAEVDLVRSRLTIDLFSVPLGVAALGTSWTVLAPALPGAALVGDVIEVLAAIGWVGMTSVYVAHVIRDRTGLADFRHPTWGPLTAYIPVIGMIVATHFVVRTGLAELGYVIVALSALLLLVEGWLLRTWVVGRFAFNSFHPGYLLPLVAGAFVASLGLAVAGFDTVAWAAMGVGFFFWVVVGTGVIGRLVFGPRLPDAGRPTIAILLSPPATAASAWFALAGGEPGPVLYMILGVLAIVLVSQLMLLPVYLRSPFSLAFWAFTFPLCATVTVAVRILAVAQPAAWGATSVGLVLLASAVITAIGVRSFGVLSAKSRPPTKVSRRKNRLKRAAQRPTAKES